MNVFKAVKENVTPMDAAKHYGLSMNRKGMCICPFHNDRHPSMKIDDRTGGSFYCFGCQESGDVISLTAKLFGLSNHEAAVKLAGDFCVSYDDPGKGGFVRSTKSEKQFPDKKAADREFAIRKRELCGKIVNLMREVRAEKLNGEEKAIQTLEENKLYIWAVNRLDVIEERYEYLLKTTDDEVRAEIDDIEKEVRKDVGEFEEIRRRCKDRT